jgi:2-desacetyl-2-hydroxyethyl bacteriochlorophyllide A dehydrogenase
LTTMKAIVWTGPGRIEVRSLPQPVPKSDEVLLRVDHAGICGSDLHIRQGEHPRAKPPLVLGHEISGKVAQTVPGPGGWQEGQAVAVYPVIGCGECGLCRSGREYICSRLGLIGIDRHGGMAEFVSVPADKLHRLPDGLAPVLGALVEPMAVGVHVAARGGSVEGATVAVVGAGPIGLCVGIAATAKGAERVLISDISEFRLAAAKAFGFTAVHAGRQSLRDAVAEATAGRGATCVVEATGVPAAAEGLLNLSAIGGRIVVAGIFPRPIPVDLRDLSFRELKLIGTRHYTPGEFDEAIRIVASGRFPLENIAGDIYPLDRGVEAFDRAASGKDSVKVLLETQ